MNGKVMMSEGDSHVCIGMAFRIFSDGKIEFLVFPTRRETEGGRQAKIKFKFPGGRQEPSDHGNVRKTLRREFQEEVAANGFKIYFDEHPILVFPESDEENAKLVHWKLAFLIRRFEGERRKTEKPEARKVDDDGRVLSQTFLGPSEWIEAKKLFAIFKTQGFATRFHFLSAVFALNSLVLSYQNVALRYGHIMEQFEPLVSDFSWLMKNSPGSIGSFVQTLKRYQTFLHMTIR